VANETGSSPTVVCCNGRLIVNSLTYPSVKPATISVSRSSPNNRVVGWLRRRFARNRIIRSSDAIPSNNNNGTGCVNIVRIASSTNPIRALYAVRPAKRSQSPSAQKTNDSDRQKLTKPIPSGQLSSNNVQSSVMESAPAPSARERYRKPNTNDTTYTHTISRSARRSDTKRERPSSA